MRPINNNLISKLLIGTFIVAMINFNLFSYIVLNGSGQGFEDGGEIAGVNNSTIETYVIEGGAYFLNANASIQALLNRVELLDLKGIDYRELLQLVDNALENTGNAVLTYDRLIKKAEVTPYNLDFIDRLKAFNYDSLREENGLNAIIFKTVVKYLSIGDITGSFKYVHANLLIVKGLLISIRNDTAGSHMPNLKSLWKLNELFAESLLFGSYAARIFHSIL